MTFFFKHSSTAQLRLSFAAACLAGTALAAPAMAQTANELPTLEVTSPTLVPTPVDQIGSSVTVITAADLERDQRRTAYEALQAVPGLNIVQQGGPGNLTSVYMRGTNSNHTKILIDGIDVADPSNPGNFYDLGQLITSDIERIEVLRGPQSGLYGSDAIGGVISITTKAGKGPPKITAMVEGGSQGTINASTGVSGSTDRLSYSLNASRYETASTPVTPLDLLPPGQARNNDSNINRTLSTKLGYDFNDYLAFNFVGRYTKSELRFTGDNYPYPADRQSTTDGQQIFTRSEAVLSLFDGRFKNYFGINYTNQTRFNTDPYGYPGPYSSNDGQRLKFDWRGVAQVLPGQTVVVGAEHERETFTNGSATLLNPNQISSYIRAENSNRGAYAELQSNFNDRFFVTSNIRVDDNEAFGEHTTYRVAPAFIVPGLETKLKASYGTGFKAPTLGQLYDTTYGSNNPNLKPEESTGYDVGFEQPIANNRIRFGTTYFDNDLTNLIANGPFFGPFINVRSAHTHGFETFAAVSFTDRLSVRFDHTLTDIEASNGTGPMQLTRRPRNKASVAINWRPTDDLSLSATAISVGQFYDVPRVGGAISLYPGFTVINLAANYTVAPGVTAFARVNNLLNEQYQQAIGFQNPGLGVFGGIRLVSDPIGK